MKTEKFKLGISCILFNKDFSRKGGERQVQLGGGGKGDLEGKSQNNYSTH